MASAAVDLLIGKIVSVLENEASLIGGLHDELNDLKNELGSLKSFLQDANNKRALTEVEKSWVEEVRGMSCRVENIIDEYMYQMNQEQSEGKFRRIFDFPKNLWVRNQIARELQNIKRMIKDIPERSQRYNINLPQKGKRCGDDVDLVEATSSHGDQRWMQNQAESALFFKDDDLVGIEADRRQLVRWLTDGEPQRTVISVVGMGGSGKSTLVANAYNHGNIKRHFHCCAWITVSQTYNDEDLLRRMIEEFFHASNEAVPKDLSNMRYKRLVEILLNHLRPRRYVVVLDDVWRGEVWKQIKYSLPDEGRGSRVLLTTRHQDIASSSFDVKSYVHHRKPLGDSDAWDLFCMKAFSNNSNKSCPQELENLAQDLVTKCEGLPLAIVTLGGVMSSKKLEWEWRQARDGLNWMLSNNTELETVKKVLLLSFNDLPCRLKCCFLYCSLFPEDYQIRRKRLIRLWMAEGFVEKVKKITPEEVAESYLMELINRSMLQVVQRNPAGRPKAIKMHDLMRELAIAESEKEKFCALYDGSTEGSDQENGAHRLSILSSTDREVLKSWKSISHLRSLFVFAVNVNISPSLSTLPSGLRLLRVLDLQDSPIVKLPDELVHLFNLRYLNLRRSKVKKLPKSIGRLQSLQTLDIRDSEIEVLPAGITKLQNLRHLIMYRYNLGHQIDFDYVCGTPAPPNICELKNLQVLACVEAEEGLMKQVRKMTQLTKIGITKVKETDEQDLCVSVQNMKLLRLLLVMVTDEEENLRIDTLSSAPPHLKTLVLVGKLEKVPRWFHSLQTLTFLYLHWSRLKEDPLPYIQALPNLGKLILINAYTEKQLCFSTGFHKLTILDLRNLPQLNEITIEKGVMPGLQKFDLGKCEELKMLPCGIEYLMHLQELILNTVSEELIHRIRGEESVDRSKVGHIPVIEHYFQSSDEWFYESLS